MTPRKFVSPMSKMSDVGSMHSLYDPLFQTFVKKIFIGLYGSTEPTYRTTLDERLATVKSWDSSTDRLGTIVSGQSWPSGMDSDLDPRSPRDHHKLSVPVPSNSLITVPIYECFLPSYRLNSHFFETF